MTYKEYLRFRRKMAKIRKAGQILGAAAACVGLVLVVLMMGAADSPDLASVAKVYGAGLGLIAIGAAAGAFRLGGE